VGKDSTGKTTLAHQIAKGVMGLPGFENLLGFPLRPLPPGKRVLILVADRPERSGLPSLAASTSRTRRSSASCATASSG
ncbi:MAG TPA: hypothetical protein GX718_00095, partial [Brevibacterium sp.]|nr:hypothetical protein [Brevibacterium sp.]